MRKPTKQNKTKARVKSHLRVQMAAQQSKQKNRLRLPHPLPPPPDTTTKWRRTEARLPNQWGDWKEWKKKSPCNRDSDLQLNEMLEHNWECGVCQQRWQRERNSRGWRREERKKEGRAHPPGGPAPPRTGPSNPCTRSELRAYHTPVLCRRGHTRPVFERVQRARNRARECCCSVFLIGQEI
jgi:hypothetical protein